MRSASRKFAGCGSSARAASVFALPSAPWQVRAALSARTAARRPRAKAASLGPERDAVLLHRASRAPVSHSVGDRLPGVALARRAPGSARRSSVRSGASRRSPACAASASASAASDSCSSYSPWSSTWPSGADRAAVVAADVVEDSGDLAQVARPPRRAPAGPGRAARQSQRAQAKHENQARHDA